MNDMRTIPKGFMMAIVSESLQSDDGITNPITRTFVGLKEWEVQFLIDILNTFDDFPMTGFGSVQLDAPHMAQCVKAIVTHHKANFEAASGEIHNMVRQFNTRDTWSMHWGFQEMLGGEYEDLCKRKAIDVMIFDIEQPKYDVSRHYWNIT